MDIQPQPSLKTGFISIEGDDLYYTVRGDGPPLLFIAGGGGEGNVFNAVANILTDHYQVITYDRRGNGRSTRHDPQNFEVSQQSRDAAALLTALSAAPAYIVGTSSGAVIALDIAKTQPQVARLIVVHEPPVVQVLPDRQKYLRFFADLYQMAYRWGSWPAMLRFIWALKFFWPMIWQALRSGQPQGAAPLAPEPQGPQDSSDFFLKGELLPVTNYLPDINRIKANNVNVVMAVGEWTRAHKLFYGRTAPIVAAQLGCPLAFFPGHHVSYEDQPIAWAAKLRTLLTEA